MTHCSLVVCLELSLSTPLPLLLGWKGQGFQVLRLSLHHAFLLLRRHWPCLLSWAGRETGLPRRRSSKVIPAAELVWDS